VDPSSLETVLVDVFSSKSTKTLLSRSGSFLTFLSYCNLNCFAAFPITESVVYGYLCSLRTNKEAATKSSSFKSSLAFSMGMLGLDGVEEVLSSSRISGAVFHQLLTKPPLKQRRPLLADEVYRLEMICREGLDIRDQVFAGFLLFLVFGWARSNDTAAVQQIVWDGRNEDGFIRVDTRTTKTSRTISKRTRFLPLISVRLGLSDEPWADSWSSDRAGAGLQDSRNDGSEFPLMPAPLLSGGWSDRPLNASEVRKWAMELLLSGDPGTELELLGSHSGKATTLSWMSKVGASPDVRRHLGYHVQPGDISMLTYSRGAAAEPLRQLAKMISLIRTGHFDPDKSRSGYMSSDLRAYGFDNWVNKNMMIFMKTIALYSLLKVKVRSASALTMMWNLTFLVN